MLRSIPIRVRKKREHRVHNPRQPKRAKARHKTRRQTALPKRSHEQLVCSSDSSDSESEHRRRARRIRALMQLNAPSETEDSDLDLEREQLERRQRAFTFNAIKVFGAFKFSTMTAFLKKCKRTGIHITQDQVLNFAAKGYRGKFDSRHVLIVFKNTKLAADALEALQYATRNKLSVRKWGLEPKMITTQRSRNRYATLSVMPDEEYNEELRLREPEARENYSRLATWNARSAVSKQKNIRRFVKDKSVDVFTITETHQTSDKRPPGANGFQWFGRPTQSSARGGVGILIRSELIHNTKVTTFNRDAPDSFHLAVQPHNSRTTLISVVYGKTGLTEAEAEAQWGSYSRDLRRIRRKIGDFDHIFTGDINGRMGKPQNPVEEAHLGLYGESTRNPS